MLSATQDKRLIGTRNQRICELKYGALFVNTSLCNDFLFIYINSQKINNQIFLFIY